MSMRIVTRPTAEGTHPLYVNALPPEPSARSLAVPVQERDGHWLEMRVGLQ